jgi:hypothetical protein
MAVRPGHTRGATLFAFQSREKSRTFVTHSVTRRAERPLCLVIAPRGNHPPAPTCSSVKSNRRLSSASRSRRRSEVTCPFRTYTLLRIAVGRRSHTQFVQRGSVCLCSCFPALRIAGRRGGCQLQIDETSAILDSQGQYRSADAAKPVTNG